MSYVRRPILLRYPREEERRLAMASADQNVRRIHQEMAARYDSLASPNAILATEVAAEPEQRSA